MDEELQGIVKEIELFCEINFCELDTEADHLDF